MYTLILKILKSKVNNSIEMVYQLYSLSLVRYITIFFIFTLPILYFLCIFKFCFIYDRNCIKKIIDETKKFLTVLNYIPRNIFVFSKKKRKNIFLIQQM